MPCLSDLLFESIKQCTLELSPSEEGEETKEDEDDMGAQAAVKEEADVLRSLGLSDREIMYRPPCTVPP